MRVGVFTPLLSQLPLKDVLAKLKALGISTVELATGNYPGDAHCKLTMLEDSRRACRVPTPARGSRIQHQRSQLPRQRVAP